MTFRKIVFWTHLGIGTTVGLVVLNMAASGIMMTFEPQIVAWSERNVRRVQSPVPEAHRLGIESILARAAEVKSGLPPTGVTLWSNPDAPLLVNFGREGGLYLHPTTGDVLGGRSKTHVFLHEVEEWHRWFGNKKIGKPITGGTCVGFSLLLLSGLYLWWPKRWTWTALRSVTLFNPRLTGKPRDWNWHNVIGFWCAPMILVTTLTGLIISYPWANTLLFRLVGETPPTQRADLPLREPREKGGTSPRGDPRGDRQAESSPLVFPATGLDVLLVRAKDKVSGWNSITLRFPQKPGAPLMAIIEQERRLGPPARSQLTFDSSTGQELKWEPASTQTFGKRLRGWVVPLHTGRAGGLMGQLLAGLSSVGALLLVWTGLSMAWARYHRRCGNGAQQEDRQS